jgi:hypothetical protein
LCLRRSAELRRYSSGKRGGAALLVSLSGLDGIRCRPGLGLYTHGKVANCEIRVWHFVIENGY